jgi:hypothetical protein
MRLKVSPLSTALHSYCLSGNESLRRMLCSNHCRSQCWKATRSHKQRESR